LLLLDTCCLLWLAADQTKLSPAATALLAKHRGGLWVSAISAFEIGIKSRKKALELPLPPEAWYARALEFHGLREIPIDGAIAVRSTALPPHHADPCDRLIVATAERHHLTILTPDPLIRAYAEAATAW